MLRTVEKLTASGRLQTVDADPAGAAAVAVRKKVLVVDDSLTVRELERKLLTNRGYQVTVAVDGMDGWNAVRAEHFDLVITDIDMPRMDGWLLCEIINNVKRWKKIPVVFQSALVGSENIKRGISLGAHSYLEKPYTREGVNEVVEAVFNTKVHEAPATPEINMVVKQVAEASGWV